MTGKRKHICPGRSHHQRNIINFVLTLVDGWDTVNFSWYRKPTSVLYPLRQAVIKSIGSRVAQRVTHFLSHPRQTNWSFEKRSVIVPDTNLYLSYIGIPVHLATLRLWKRSTLTPRRCAAFGDNQDEWRIARRPFLLDVDRLPVVLLFLRKACCCPDFVNISSADDECRIKWALIIEQARFA